VPRVLFLHHLHGGVGYVEQAEHEGVVRLDKTSVFLITISADSEEETWIDRKPL
jgi:hypothetical protein